MNDPTLPERDFGPAFSGLRDAVRQHAAAPTAAAIRGRAEHQVRVRRTATILVVAAAVAAVAVGGVTALRDSALPAPLPPGESTTPTPDPSVTGPEPPTPTPTPSQPPAQVRDPITKVKWLSATIDIPQETACPKGDVRFRALPDDPNTGYSGTAWPRIFIHGPSVAYGDLTGDENDEAVLIGSCLTGPEDSGDGAGRLLVVKREPDGKLTGIAWVGQPGAMFNGQWVADKRLYTDTAPWHVNWGYALGEAKAYEWRGNAFTEVDVRKDYPGLVPARGRPATPVDLSPVADELKCAAGKPVPTGPGMTQVRFDANSMATVDGVRLSAQQPGAPDSMPHLLDLDGDGHRRLLVALSCGGEGDKLGTPNLLLLEHFGGAYRAIDAVDLPEELRKGDGYYQWTVAGRELTVTYVDTNTKYVWNGEQFQRSGQ